VTARAPPPAGGGDLGTTALLAGTAGLLGLLGVLPSFLGPAIAVVGVVGSWFLRRREPRGTGPLAMAPSLLALALLTASAPAGPATDLFAALTALAFLLWLADDPARPAGRRRRALPTLAPAALGVGFAWGLALGLPGETANVGLAGSLIAGALVVLALLFGRLSLPTGDRPPAPAPAAPPPSARLKSGARSGRGEPR
jgi:hypothetical protein